MFTKGGSLQLLGYHTLTHTAHTCDCRTSTVRWCSVVEPADELVPVTSCSSNSLSCSCRSSLRPAVTCRTHHRPCVREGRRTGSARI